MGQLIGALALLWAVGKAFGWPWVAFILVIAIFQITFNHKDF
jgi:hypothetical protein